MHALRRSQAKTLESESARDKETGRGVVRLGGGIEG